MSNVIDELKVVFSADTEPLTAVLAQVSAQLGTLEGMSGVAEASLTALAAEFDGGFAGLAADAYGAGADAGEAFARGLRAQADSVKSAAAYLSASAVGLLGGSYSGGAGDTGGADATGFETSILSGGAGAAGSVSQKTVTEIKVPLNVDGVKLGEACIRAVGRVSEMTGRAHIAL